MEVKKERNEGKREAAKKEVKLAKKKQTDKKGEGKEQQNSPLRRRNTDISDIRESANIAWYAFISFSKVTEKSHGSRCTFSLYEKHWTRMFCFDLPNMIVFFQQDEDVIHHSQL